MRFVVNHFDIVLVNSHYLVILIQMNMFYIPLNYTTQKLEYIFEISLYIYLR